MPGTHLLAGMGVGLRCHLQMLWPVPPETVVFRGCLAYYRARKTARVITAQFEKHTNNSCYYDVIEL